MVSYVEPRPVKLFAGVLLAPTAAWSDLQQRLCAAWGPEDLVGEPQPFDWTSYYTPEMGEGLQRRFIGFAGLVPPSRLAALKRDATAIEADLAHDGDRRSANIDVGYLDLHKVVLASTKEGPFKLALQGGVWADMALHYRKGRFVPLPWTFADFRSERYQAFFLRLRELYKEGLRKAGR